jgi:MFS family permease
VGILPAFVAVYAGLKLHEPERWAEIRAEREAHAAARPTPLELFSRRLWRDTLVGSGLACVAVVGLWGATNWTPSIIYEILRPHQLDPVAASHRVSYAVMSLNAGAILGYLVCPLVAEGWNRRGAFLVMLLGSAVSLPATFLLTTSYGTVLALLPILGFFTNGLFSGFPVYLPELYPTRLRATGAGFCFNAGRILAAPGPFLTGYLVVHLGTFARAASSVTFIYLLGLIPLALARETKGEVIR